MNVFIFLLVDIWIVVAVGYFCLPVSGQLYIEFDVYLYVDTDMFLLLKALLMSAFFYMCSGAHV